MKRKQDRKDNKKKKAVALMNMIQINDEDKMLKMKEALKNDSDEEIETEKVVN